MQAVGRKIGGLSTLLSMNLGRSKRVSSGYLKLVRRVSPRDLYEIWAFKRYLLDNPDERDRLADNAFEAIWKYLQGNALLELVGRLVTRG